MAGLRPRPHHHRRETSMTDKEIIQKLTVELEFVASTFGARSNLSPRKYAEMLLDFIKTNQDRQTQGDQS